MSFLFILSTWRCLTRSDKDCVKTHEFILWSWLWLKGASKNNRKFNDVVVCTDWRDAGRSFSSRSNWPQETWLHLTLVLNLSLFQFQHQNDCNWTITELAAAKSEKQVISEPRLEWKLTSQATTSPKIKRFSSLLKRSLNSCSQFLFNSLQMTVWAHLGWHLLLILQQWGAIYFISSAFWD